MVIYCGRCWLLIWCLSSIANEWPLIKWACPYSGMFGSPKAYLNMFLFIGGKLAQVVGIEPMLSLVTINGYAYAY